MMRTKSCAIPKTSARLLAFYCTIKRQLNSRSKAKLREALFQIIPGNVGDLPGGATRLGRVRAKQDVASDFSDLQVRCNLSQTL